MTLHFLKNAAMVGGFLLLAWVDSAQIAKNQ